MAQLQYRTRGQVSPQGKPRVYFACHGEDHQGFFTEISDEILKISDCAVFYYEPGEVAPDEDYYLNLGRMQLFVMPVTTRLLYTENRAMDVEFRYAMEHHIPVLPLMQEQGLEQKYGEKFGDLQFLDKNISDPTAIPYAEKLKKYLESVLVGDELAARVRAAFDAYIFLSYRKKDRKYAQELMRLLHRDEACRDIAIWYDEFLTPGEDFNASIRAALDKSDLFVLTVTPNLVNEPNYIIEHEYPMAMDAGKPILPAEMVATDAEALRASYAGIPDSVDPQNEQALTGAMLEAMRALALRENDGDPQHNFFIGLAYLGGIDVEVDHERAVRLITGAAEAGLVEAMEKLVSMYENGEGVQRDYREAIAWREKRTELARIEYEQTGADQAALRYFHCLRTLGDARKAVADLPAAKTAYEAMCALMEDHGQGELLWGQVLGYGSLGDIYFAEGNLPEAKKWYSKALAINEQVAQTEGGAVLPALSDNYAKMGNLCRAEGSLAEARVWYAKATQICEELAKAGTAEAKCDLSVSYELLGDICVKEGNFAEARKWYTQCLTIQEELARTGTEDILRDLGVTYGRWGDLCYTEGNLAEAKQWYTKRLEIHEKLAQTGTVQALRDLSVSYVNLGEIFFTEGNREEARRCYARDLEICEKLARTGTAKALRDLSACYSKTGELCQAEGDLAAARDWYMKWLDICEKLAQTGTAEALRDLLVCYDRLGNLCREEGDMAGAKTWCVQCLDICERLARTGSAEALHDLGGSYNNMAKICRGEGDVAEAKKWYIKELEIRERLAQTETVRALQDLGANYINLGLICQAEENLQEAKKWYRKCAGVYEKLAHTRTVKVMNALSTVYNVLGDICQKEGNRTEAVEWFEKCLQVRELLIQTRTVESYDELAVCYYKLGAAKKDVALLKKAGQVFEILIKNCPDVQRYRRNLQTVHKMIQSIQDA